MKASELRIGNLVYYGRHIVPIKSIHIESVFKDSVNVYIEINENLQNYIVDIDEIKPIPLTEEWLLKFGFKKDLGNDLYLDSTSTSFFIWENNRVELLDNKNNICISHCDYVHQLQNLYFALTREEL
jgi:hypothetical protein